MRNIIVAAGLVAGLMLAGCNTVEGAGQDAKSAGKAVSKTADDVKKKL